MNFDSCYASLYHGDVHDFEWAGTCLSSPIKTLTAASSATLSFASSVPSSQAPTSNTESPIATPSTFR